MAKKKRRAKPAPATPEDRRAVLADPRAPAHEVYASLVEEARSLGERVWGLELPQTERAIDAALAKSIKDSQGRTAARIARIILRFREQRLRLLRIEAELGAHAMEVSARADLTDLKKMLEDRIATKRSIEGLAVENEERWERPRPNDRGQS